MGYFRVIVYAIFLGVVFSKGAYSNSKELLLLKHAKKTQNVLKKCRSMIVYIGALERRSFSQSTKAAMYFFYSDIVAKEFLLSNIAPLGSGVIVSDSGHVVTNYHLVSGRETLKVVLNDGQIKDVKLIGYDERTNLAVLKIYGSNEKLPYASFGDSSNLETGSVVFAMGNPYGLETTVLSGFLSSSGRSAFSGELYTSLIQLDFLLSRGMSGGGVFNLRGELVGISTSIFSNKDKYHPTGMAIPSHVASKVVTDIIEYGHVNSPWLGVRVKEVLLDKQKIRGVEVVDVDDSSPAFYAGVKVGDVIVSFRNKAIVSLATLHLGIQEASIGERVTLDIIRGGSRQMLSVRLNSQGKADDTSASLGATSNLYFGMKFSTITQDLRVQYDLSPLQSGVVVHSVASGSLADLKGVSVGDVIEDVNGLKVRTLEDCIAAMRYKKNEALLFLYTKYGYKFLMLSNKKR